MIELVPFGPEHVARATAWERDPRVHDALPDLDPAAVEARMAERLAPTDDAHHYALVNSAGLLIGVASIYRQPEAVSFRLYIGPEHQHHGYGRRAIAALRDEGLRWAPGMPVIIRVFADEPGLFELCEALGFRRVGHENARYLGHLRPLYVMAVAPDAEVAVSR